MKKICLVYSDHKSIIELSDNDFLGFYNNHSDSINIDWYIVG